MRVASLLFGLFVLASSSLGAGARLDVQAPALMLAGAHLVVEANIEPDSSNSAIQVTAESPDWYRSSEIQLAGDSAPRISTFEFKDLPRGTYEIRAVLLGSNGQQRASVVRRLEVIRSAR
jgi:predicted nicotinamide N-methyase